MAKLRSGSNSETDLGVTSKGVTKVGKGKSKVKKGAKTTEANNISTVYNTSGHSNVSETSLSSLQSPSGFGFVAPGPSHSTQN